jgi:hypothetical protein
VTHLTLFTEEKLKALLTNPFLIVVLCFGGGAVFICWLWFSLFDLGTFWTVKENGILPFGITEEGKVGLLIGTACGGIGFARAWAFCRWH